MRNVQINSNFLYLCGRKMKRMTNYLEELNESQRNAVLYNDCLLYTSPSPRD